MQPVFDRLNELVFQDSMGELRRPKRAACNDFALSRASGRAVTTEGPNTRWPEHRWCGRCGPLWLLGIEPNVLVDDPASNPKFARGSPAVSRVPGPML